MTWGAIGGAAVGVFGNAVLGGSGGGGGGGGSTYQPRSLAPADDTWTNAMHSGYDISSGARAAAIPAYQDAFGRQMGIDYGPYLQRAGQSGGAYGAMGDIAMGQMPQYGQQAATAQGQQMAMYGAGQHVMDTAFDPQNALYDRTAQRFTDQIRSGQAARGLGNSEVGMMEEAGAMGNFNIDWQNAQLGRQATGIQAGTQADAAGVQQGRMYGADMSAGLAAGAAGAGYYGQAGQVPMTAQQFAAQAPGQAANNLVGGYGGVQQMYGNVQSSIVPYLNAGIGATQQNWQNNYTANRDMTSGMAQIGQAVAPSVAGWFGSGNGNNGGTQYNPWTGMNSSDIAYG